VMETTLESFEVIKGMAEIGNPNSVTDAGVGALCARAAIHGAFLNVKINAGGLDDKKFVKKVLKRGKEIVKKADEIEQVILNVVNAKIEV